MISSVWNKLKGINTKAISKRFRLSKVPKVTVNCEDLDRVLTEYQKTVEMLEDAVICIKTLYPEHPELHGDAGYSELMSIKRTLNKIELTPWIRRVSERC